MRVGGGRAEAGGYAEDVLGGEVAAAALAGEGGRLAGVAAQLVGLGEAEPALLAAEAPPVPLPNIGTEKERRWERKGT